MGTIQALNLLRYAPADRSVQRAVTGKLASRNLKLTAGLKNKNWAIPQIKNHKRVENLGRSEQRHDTKN